MTSRYSMQISVARPTCGSHIKIQTLEIKHRVHAINFVEIDRNFLEMTQYDWQLLCAKQYGNTYTIIFF